MKKFRAQQLFRNAILFMGLFSFLAFQSCKDDDPVIEDPIATFQFEISQDNFLAVVFTNYSTNATTYLWNFDDGQTSTETNPTHTYAEVGIYDVQLTATNSAGVTHTFTQTIDVKDPAEALTLLAGTTSKTWKLHRVDVSMGVGPSVETPYLWFSLENNGVRPCLYYHEFTFNRDMEYIFDDKGSFWGEGGVFPEDQVGTCFEATAANMINADGVDVSAWLSGTHQFEYNASTNRVTIIGEGAWIGIPKVATDGEVKVPQNSVSFNISIEEHDGYDLMVVQFLYDGGAVVWQFNYASYSNPALEPEVVSFMVDFSYDVEDRTVTFENNSKDAVSYSWDFGDGNTSTEENPIHTYADDGAYIVVLTGTSATGETKERTRTVTIDTTTLTEAPPTPTHDEADVISIYSHTYTDITGVNLDPDWSQATVTEEVEVAGQMVLRMAGLNYQGIDWADNAQDVSGKTYLHVDVWCSGVTDINISAISPGNENPVLVTTEAGVWKSIDIPLSDYTVPDLTQIIQLKFDDAGTGTSPTIYVANIYFH